MSTSHLIIEPQDTRYKQILRAALKSRDIEALNDLKGNTHKPIFYIKSWFFYALMASSWEQSEECPHVAIFSPQTRLDFAKFNRHRKGLDSHDLVPPIALDTYNFLD